MNVEVYLNQKRSGQLGDLLDGPSPYTFLGGDSAAGGLGGAVGGSAVGGLGGSISRAVVFRVIGSLGSTLEAVIPGGGIYANLGAANQIGQRLTSQGWSISNVSEVNSGSINPYTRAFLITALVENEYSDSDVITNARRDLSSIMSVSSVTIDQSSPAAYSSGNTGGGLTASLNSLFGGSASTAGATTAGFLGGLGAGAIGTGTLLIGGLLLILFLRK